MMTESRNGPKPSPSPVLFIEDDVTLESFRDYLNEMGFNCKQVLNLSEAFDALTKQEFNLLLVDIMLAPGPLADRFPDPLSAGLHFIDEVKAGSIPDSMNPPDTPMVVVTGVPSDTIVQQCKDRVGAENVFEKPFRPKDVRQRMLELLGATPEA